MKVKNTIINTLAWTWAAFSVLGIAEARDKASMQQGRHRIIVRRAEDIKENLSEVKKATEAASDRVESLTKLEEEQFIKSENEDLPEKERLRHLAASLEHRTEVYLSVKKLALGNGRRLKEVEYALTDIDEALAKSPGLSTDPATRRTVEEVKARLKNSLEIDAKLSRLATRAAEAGGVTAETRRLYQISQGQLASAIEVTSRRDGNSRAEAFRKQVDELRRSVRARRTRMAMIAKVTDRSLQEIEVFAATEGTRVIFDEIDRSLQGIAPADDPLGLKLLQPEANRKYWDWRQRDAGIRRNKRPTQGNGSFIPIAERIDLDQL
jgi:hypothetical protein